MEPGLVLGQILRHLCFFRHHGRRSGKHRYCGYEHLCSPWLHFCSTRLQDDLFNPRKYQRSPRWLPMGCWDICCKCWSKEGDGSTNNMQGADGSRQPTEQELKLAVAQ